MQFRGSKKLRINIGKFNEKPQEKLLMQSIGLL